jgi:hypothetical protein
MKYEGITMAKKGYSTRGLFGQINHYDEKLDEITRHVIEKEVPNEWSRKNKNEQHQFFT